MRIERSTFRQLGVAARVLILATIALGIIYPLAVFGVGQVLFPNQANGQLQHTPDGQVVGSALIGQQYLDDSGEPLPEYFQSRPSAAGDGYDTGASGGSNLAATNDDLALTIQERKAAVAEFNDVALAEVPADAVTASASGLDPDISVDYALIQVDRIAEVRGLDVDAVRSLVENSTQARDLGILGEPRVNVLALNRALDRGLGEPSEG